MKKLLPFLLVFLSIQGIGQKVTIDNQGNYHSAAKPADKKTDKIYIDEDGVSHPVYVNSKDKPYYIRKSKKTGKEYKAYLKID